MRPRTIPQNNRFHGLCAKLDLESTEKRHLIRNFSKGRSTSSADLNYFEMQQCIKHLERMVGEKYDPLDVMRKKIIHYFHEMGWQLDNGKADMQRIEAWMRKMSYLRKSMNSYTAKELPYLVSQVEIMYKKHLNSV